MDGKTENLKKGFFKKVWYSIFKLERYGEMSAEGLGRAIKYTAQIAIIFAMILSLATIYQLNEKVEKGKKFLNEQVGVFTYNDGILNVEKQEPVIAPSTTFGTIIVDTNVEKEEDINKYINSMDTNIGILVLKDRIVIKGLTKGELLNYKYITLLKDIGIEKLDNQEFLNLLNEKIWNFYIQIFLIIFIYCLASTIISTLLTALILSMFGWLATVGAKIKIRFVAIYNLAIYSLTLSMLLQALYIAVNTITGFTIKYFQVMYIGVAAIYLIASIFMIKSEFIKKQMQEIQNAQKIKEEQENEVEEKKDEKQEENKDNEEKDTNDSPNSEDKENKENEPEESGASLVKKEGA